MSSRQHFPKAHEPESDRQAPPGERRSDEGTQTERANVYRYPMEQMGALTLLGLARAFEWQAAALHTMLIEWTRQQQEWLRPAVEAEHALSRFGFSREHLERMQEVARSWGTWGVTAQLSMAHGLMSSCKPESLGLPANSGRRAGFDLGRRTGANVIVFPDRRKYG